MRKNLGPGTLQRKMFDDYWEFIQEFYIVEKSDEYWNEMVRKSTEFVTKYKGKFPQDLMLAYLESREREYRAKRNTRG